MLKHDCCGYLVTQEIQEGSWPYGARVRVDKTGTDCKEGMKLSINEN